VLNTGSPDGGTMLGGGGNFRIWGLVAGSRPVECSFEGYT
jgi:hypothetical protein